MADQKFALRDSNTPTVNLHVWHGITELCAYVDDPVVVLKRRGEKVAVVNLAPGQHIDLVEDCHV